MKYLNQFHKDTTERSLKEIAEMKKTPLNYEEEYWRHKAMNKISRELENNPTVTSENWKQYCDEAMERERETFDKENEKKS